MTEQKEIMVPMSEVQRIVADKLAPLADYKVLPRILLTSAIRDIEFELVHWEELAKRRQVEQACMAAGGPARKCSSGSCED